MGNMFSPFQAVQQKLGGTQCEGTTEGENTQDGKQGKVHPLIPGIDIKGQKDVHEKEREYRTKENQGYPVAAIIQQGKSLEQPAAYGSIFRRYTQSFHNNGRFTIKIIKIVVTGLQEKRKPGSGRSGFTIKICMRLIVRKR